MSSMLEQDEKDDFEKTKSFIEYLASFINPEAVQQLKNMTNNAKQVSDEDFAKTLEQLFGDDYDPAMLKSLRKK